MSNSFKKFSLMIAAGLFAASLALPGVAGAAVIAGNDAVGGTPGAAKTESVNAATDGLAATGGAGAAGSNSAATAGVNGGAGGKLTLTGAVDAAANPIAIAAGVGGVGGNASDVAGALSAGNGGAGGATVDQANYTTTGSFNAIAGAGGAGGAGIASATGVAGNGGNGGDLDLAGAYNLSGTAISLFAGAGGAGGAVAATGAGNGGNGGKLTLSGSFAIDSEAGAVLLTAIAGNGGTDNNGQAGNGGNLIVKGAFDVTGSNIATLNFASGTATDALGGNVDLTGSTFSFTGATHTLILSKTTASNASGDILGTIKSVSVSASDASPSMLNFIEQANPNAAAGTAVVIDKLILTSYNDYNDPIHGAVFNAGEGLTNSSITNYEINGLGNVLSAGDDATYTFGAGNKLSVNLSDRDLRTTPGTAVITAANTDGTTPSTTTLDFTGFDFSDRKNFQLNVHNLQNLYKVDHTATPFGAVLLEETGAAGIDGAGVIAGLTADDVHRTYDTHGLANYLFDVVVHPDAHGAALVYAGTDISTAKPYWEAWLANVITLNEGFRTVEQNMYNQMTTLDPDESGVAVSFGGSWMNSDTGSSVDVDTYSIVLSIAHKFTTSFSHLTAGLFLEGGWGDYDTNNSFRNWASIDGDGDTDYFGGGLFVRNDFTGLPGFYMEAAGRIGSINNDFDVSYEGTDTGYDTDAMYWGLHLGLGYIWEIDEANQLEFYTKSFWTRVDEEKTHSDTGEELKFDAVDSLRTRLGARYSYAIDTNFSAYIGAAWEHEFDAEADGRYRGTKIWDSPDNEGSSGLGEIGVTFKPDESPVSFELAGFGSVGQNEGGGAQFSVKFEF